jgi:hypothetical protein
MIIKLRKDATVAAAPLWGTLATAQLHPLPPLDAPGRPVLPAAPVRPPVSG